MTASLQQAAQGSIGATRTVFFVAGAAIASWAPLVPLAADRLQLDDAALGALLLFLGLGSMASMPLTARLVDKLGCRHVITFAGAMNLLLLPLLAVAGTRAQLAVILAIFGATLGTVDAAMNIQAVLVERSSGRRLMSGFHGFFSLGGILGAAAMSGMLFAGFESLTACVAMSFLLGTCLGFSRFGLLRDTSSPRRNAPLFAFPRGIVIVASVLCFIVGVVEGAIIDWSAVFLAKERGLDPALSGLGYAAFSATMTIGRFGGDAIVRQAGAHRVLFLGSMLVAGGFFLVASFQSVALSLLGFIAIGLGAANLFPILCSTSGKQNAMPPGHAVAAIVTFGYAGIMAGPALIGLGSNMSSLPASFAGLGFATLLMTAGARVAR